MSPLALLDALATAQNDLLADLLPTDVQEPLLADGSQARAVLDELEKYLAEDDVRAGEVFRSARPLLYAALGEFAAEIERHIAAFDFALEKTGPDRY